MASSSKQRAQGGGRKANSEPRLQVFKEFGGCNFELSPREFSLGKDVDQEQSDLQMNFVVIQNNAGIASNKTIETRSNLRKIAQLRSGITAKFSGPVILIKNLLYLALDDGNIECYQPPLYSNPHAVIFDDKTGLSPSHTWQSFAYVDGKLVATTQENQLWTGPAIPASWQDPNWKLSNAIEVPNPSAMSVYNADDPGAVDPDTNMTTNIRARGSLKISTTMDDDHPYRIAIAYSWINKYGPTKCSNQVTFYANYPVDEWHGGRYAQVHAWLPYPTGFAPSDNKYDVIAAEFYYTTGNSSSLLFAGRADYSSGSYITFNWFGYLDATTMWPVANLIAPDENYTKGVPASHVACIDSRMYFWGNSAQPQRLYIGGNSGNLFSVSPGTGGGFVDVEPGTSQEIRVVTKYKTQSGASIVTMLCDSPNAQKKQRYNLVENSVSLSNEQSMKSWQAEQVAGAVGCKGFNGALVCQDGLYSITQYGLALTTMTMEYNSQIRTNYVSDPIKPAFVDKRDLDLKTACIVESDGIIYLAFGAGRQDRIDCLYDNLLFCYDIDQKAWWTVSLDLDEPILNIFNFDYEGMQQGVGIITANAVYLLKNTKENGPTDTADFTTTIQTGELSTQQPQQGWFYLSQLEFRFDYFIGSVLVELTGIDQFGRKVSTKKTISHTTTAYDLAEYMRVDLRLQSYQIRITGQARFRLTHFIAKLYTMSAKQGLVWGFDDSQSFRSSGDIHPTFLDYNDIKKAIIP